jgi:hypothetical protein
MVMGRGVLGRWRQAMENDRPAAIVAHRTAVQIRQSRIQPPDISGVSTRERS